MTIDDLKEVVNYDDLKPLAKNNELNNLNKNSSIDLIYRHQQLILGKLTDQKMKDGDSSSHLVVDVILNRKLGMKAEYIVRLDEKWRVLEMMAKVYSNNSTLKNETGEKKEVENEEEKNLAGPMKAMEKDTTFKVLPEDNQIIKDSPI